MLGLLTAACASNVSPSLPRQDGSGSVKIAAFCPSFAPMPTAHQVKCLCHTLQEPHLPQLVLYGLVHCVDATLNAWTWQQRHRAHGNRPITPPEGLGSSINIVLLGRCGGLGKPRGSSGRPYSLHLACCRIYGREERDHRRTGPVQGSSERLCCHHTIFVLSLQGRGHWQTGDSCRHGRLLEVL